MGVERQRSEDGSGGGFAVAAAVAFVGKWKPRHLGEEGFVVVIDAIFDGDGTFGEDHGEQDIGDIGLFLALGGSADQGASVGEAGVLAEIDAQDVADGLDRAVFGLEADDLKDIGAVEFEGGRIGTERGVDADSFGVTDDDGVKEVRTESDSIGGGVSCVVAIFVLKSDQGFVDERQTEARDLDPRADVLGLSVPLAKSDAATARRGPDAEGIFGADFVCGSFAVKGEFGGGDLDGDAVDVEASDAVLGGAFGAEVGEVKDATEVNVEAVITGASPDAAFVAVVSEVGEEGFGEGVVVGGDLVGDSVGARADVGGGDFDVASDDFGGVFSAGPFGFDDSVGLFDTCELAEKFFSATQRSGLVVGSDAIGSGAGELEVVCHDIFEAVGAACDVDAVEDIIGKLVEVGSAGGLLKRVPVGDDVELVVARGGDPSVKVGVVGCGIFGDGRGFAVARSRCCGG